MKYIVTLNGKNYEVDVDEVEASLTAVSEAASTTAPAAAVSSVSASPTAAGTKVVAPMPGTVLSVNCSVGQAVKAGETMIVLEAMKMENDIVAPCDGVVKQLLAKKGGKVNTDDILAVI